MLLPEVALTDLATSHPNYLHAAYLASVAFGWPGGGGSYAYADPAQGIAFALTKTRLVPNFDTARSVTTILADYVAGTH